MGRLAGWPALVRRERETTWLQRIGAEENAGRRRFEHARETALEAIPAAQGRRRGRARAPWLVRRSDAGVEVDLGAWHAQYGWDLMLAEHVRERAPELLADRADSSGGNVHAR
jgi:hypothetical protein